MVARKGEHEEPGERAADRVGQALEAALTVDGDAVEQLAVGEQKLVSPGCGSGFHTASRIDRGRVRSRSLASG